MDGSSTAALVTGGFSPPPPLVEGLDAGVVAGGLGLVTGADGFVPRELSCDAGGTVTGSLTGTLAVS